MYRGWTNLWKHVCKRTKSLPTVIWCWAVFGIQDGPNSAGKSRMVDNGTRYHSSCKNVGHNPAQCPFVSFGQLTRSTMLMLIRRRFPETVYAFITFDTVPRDTAENCQLQLQRHQLSGQQQFALFETP